MDEIFVFDPVLFSLEENQFLLENLGKAPIVAIKNAAPPVNAKAVKPILDRVFELEQQQKEDGTKWVGVEALKERISIYLRENEKWARDHKRNKKAPRFPSLYSFDARGKGHLGGPGSDSDRIRTYFGPAGERLPFAIDLLPEYEVEWAAPGMTEGSLDLNLKIDSEKNRIECIVPIEEGRVCGHTESYKAESRPSYVAARARMSKHLRKATVNVEGHREVYTNEFGG